MNIWRGTALISVLVMIVLFGCGREPQTTEYKIGALLPLTGNASAIGEYIKSGMELAAEDINGLGGIKGGRVRIVFEDTKNDPKEGVSIFNRLVATQSLPVVVSAMTGVTNAVIPLADSTKTVLMATAASAAGITEHSVYAHRLFVTADLDATTMASYAAQRLDLKRVAIIHVNDDFGSSFSSIFKTTFEDGSRKIVYQEAFEKGTTDFHNLVEKLKSVAPDGIYLLGYDNNIGVLPAQIRQAGVKATLLSIGTMGQPNIIAQAGATLDGAYFTTTQFAADNPANPEAKLFAESYLRKYGKAPNYFAAFSYDAVHLLADAILNGGYSADGVRKSLASGKTYHGAMGEVRIKPNRDAEFRMVVKQIRGGVAYDAE